MTEDNRGQIESLTRGFDVKRDCFRFFCLSLLLLLAPLHSMEHHQGEVREFFKDVLLIVHFNHPHYENIEFLKEIYSPFFQNIVFYGEEKHPGVYVVKNHIGWYVHKTIRDAMQRFPSYTGYICCQDDCFMNFWNFLNLDKNKIWFHTYWLASLKNASHWWPWWNSWCGHPAAVEAYHKLPEKNIKKLERNCGEGNFSFTWADFIYIPGRYRQEFVSVSKCFDNPDVFLEIAIPTILLCIEDLEEMEKTNPYWGGSGKSISMENYRTDYSWVHPIKFSKDSNREFIRGVISTIFR